jgi:hypothetical protein
MTGKTTKTYRVLAQIIEDDIDEFVEDVAMEVGFESFYHMELEEECTNYEGYITTALKPESVRQLPRPKGRGLSLPQL